MNTKRPNIKNNEVGNLYLLKNYIRGFNTNFKYIYIFGIVVVVVCVFVVFFYTFIEDFTVERLNSKKSVSLDEFNKIFDSSMVTLPKNIYALGYDNDAMINYNIKEGVVDTFIEYFNTEILPSIERPKFYYLLCTYDGYLERNRVSNTPLVPYYPTKDEYLNKDEIKLKDPSKYPVLHSNEYVFAYCRRVNDKKVILVPDTQYISSHSHKDLFKTVDDNRVKFNEKKNICVWRGPTPNGSNENFFEPEGKNGMNQRVYFADLYNKGKFNKVDYSETFMEQKEQLKYKYILSIDGWTNQWNGIAWRLYSGSVLLKTKSVWEQWFYKDLKEWVHYVPVKNDFSDLNEQIEWCINNDDKCKEIAENARKFAIHTYDWNNVKNYTINIFNGSLALYT